MNFNCGSCQNTAFPLLSTYSASRSPNHKIPGSFSVCLSLTYPFWIGKYYFYFEGEKLKPRKPRSHFNFSNCTCISLWLSSEAKFAGRTAVTPAGSEVKTCLGWEIKELAENDSLIQHSGTSMCDAAQ